jgi:N-acetyltransferase
MIPLLEVLESLDLSRAEPGIGLLRALFSRFNARIPFETASKIVRDESVAETREKPRAPEVFWREHLESGAGGTCFARVAAFAALLEALGFSARKILGRVAEDFDHAALIVDLPGRSWLCDVGFPLPALLPAAAGEMETPLGLLRVSLSAGSLGVDLGGVPEGPRRVELFLAEVSEAEFAGHWRRTFRSGAHFLGAVYMRRELEGRVLSFSRGEVRVDDLHSRLTVPLAASRPARLAELFGVDAGLLARAFDRTGDPNPEVPDARLTAYLEVDTEPERAFAAIASPAGYRRLLEGVAEVSAPEMISDGWVLRLTPPEIGPAGEEGGLQETVVPDAPLQLLIVERRSGSTRSQSFFQAEERGGRSYLKRGMRLQGSREDLLRNDSLRGRLAGSLAVDLLAWARIL